MPPAVAVQKIPIGYELLGSRGQSVGNFRRFHFVGSTSLNFLSTEVRVELPLLAWKRVRAEVAFVHGDDECVVLQELCQEAADPESLVVERGVPVLEVRFLQRAELEMKRRLQHLVQSRDAGHELARQHRSQVQLQLLGGGGVEPVLIKVLFNRC